MGNNTTAILLTGQIRLNSERQKRNWGNLKRQLTHYDVFVCTYEKFYTTALQITEKERIFIIDTELTNITNTQFKKPNKINMKKVAWYQLYQVECAINKFADYFLNYDCILRIRNDICYSAFNFHNYITFSNLLTQQGMFSLSHDFIYSGPAKKWVELASKKILLTEISDIDNFYNLPPNYSNLMKTLQNSKHEMCRSPYKCNFFRGISGWTTFNHDLDTVLKINEKYNFNLYKVSVNNESVQVLHPKVFSNEEFLKKSKITIRDDKDIAIYDKGLLCSVYNFLEELYEHCLTNKDTGEKLGEKASLIYPIDARPEHGLLKWLLNAGPVSEAIKRNYKIILAR